MIDLPVIPSSASFPCPSLFTPRILFTKLLQSLELTQSPKELSPLHPLQPLSPAQHPVFAIAHSLRTLPDPVVRFGSSLVFRCETEQSLTIPDWISLPRADAESKMAMYILCSVVVKEESHFLTYKRLFSPVRSKSENSRFVYDLTTWSRWVKVKEDAWCAVSPKFLKSVSPYLLHYERLLF